MRRLNKKVAFLGSLFSAALIFAAIVVVLNLSRDPQEFLKDGFAAMEEVKSAVDSDTKERLYEKAERSFWSAYSRAKDNQLRQEALSQLLNVYFETDKWPFILGCWDRMITINPNNIAARFGSLRYSHILAKSGVDQAWPEVMEQTSDLLVIAEENSLLAEDVTQWDAPGIELKATEPRELGVYLYLLRGISEIEIAGSGAVTNVSEVLQQAIDDLEKVRQLSPNNIDAYRYLATAAIIKGQILTSGGNFAQMQESVAQARDYLEEAVEIAPDNPRAKIYLLQFELAQAQQEDFEQLQQRLGSLEDNYLRLAEEFSSSAQVYAALSEYYLAYSNVSYKDKREEYLDKAINAVTEAIKLDRENVAYAINAIDLYYRRYSVYNHQADIQKAIELAQQTLELPDAQDKDDPRHQKRLNNRFGLYSLLANCYIEQIINNGVKDSQYLNAVSEAVEEIEQILGSSDNPLAIKWRGLLQLAEGNKNEAIANLYKAYEQLKALKPLETSWPKDRDFALLCMWLAEIYEDGPEIGSVYDFLISALNSGIIELKPDVLLDYVEVASRLGFSTAAIQNLDVYQQYFGANSRTETLRVQTYIDDGRYEEAQRELDKLDYDSIETLKLHLMLTRARIHHLEVAAVRQSSLGDNNTKIVSIESNDRNVQLQLELLKKMIELKPDAIEQQWIIEVCRALITEDEYDVANDLVEDYLNYYPDNTAVLVYSEILRKSNPAEAMQQEYTKIEEQVISNIADPAQRAIELGKFYFRTDRSEKAIEQFNHALRRYAESTSVTEQVQSAAEYIFNAAVTTKNWDMAEQVVQVVDDEKEGGYRNLIFKARLRSARGEYKAALGFIDEYLKVQPIDSQAYLLRSRINTSLENIEASLADIRKAGSFNPLSGTIAKALATTLYHANRPLDENVTTSELSEIRTALERAVSLNPGDLELLGLYADLLSPIDPLKSVAILQNLQKADPSLENAVLLGKTATQAALKESDTDSKESMFDIAASAFEQARAINPYDTELLNYYAEYFRARGQYEQADSLMQESGDEEFLAQYYLRQGNFEKARDILESLYKTNPEDVNAVALLLHIAEANYDREGVAKYSDELVKLEDTAENNLYQLQAYLNLGLVKEAEFILQTVKDKFPDEARTQLLEALLLKKQGRIKQALEVVNDYLSRDRNNPDALRLRGEIYLYMADFDNAIRDLKAGISISDESALRISLAKAYLQTNRYESAISELKEVVSEKDAPAEARLLLENIYLELGKTAALEKFYEDITKKYPQDVTWLNRAGAYALSSGRYNEAERLYKIALGHVKNKYPDLEQKKLIEDSVYAALFDGYINSLLLGTGEKDTESWKPEKAEKVVEECHAMLDGSFAPVAYIRMAQAAAKLGDSQRAEQYYLTAIDKTGMDQQLVSEVLLRMYFILGAEKTMMYVEQKLQSDPESLAANFAMFNLCRIAGQYDKSLEYIDRCIELAGNSDSAKTGYLMQKAETFILAYNRTGENKYLKSAVREYESLLSEMPNNIMVLNNLAYVLAEDQQRLSDALEYANKALDARPNDPGMMDTYAYVLYKNGNCCEAAEFVDAALQQFDRRRQAAAVSEVYEHKGLIKEAIGENNEAFIAYKKALETGAETLSPVAKQRIEKAIERVVP